MLKLGTCGTIYVPTCRPRGLHPRGKREQKTVLFKKITKFPKMSKCVEVQRCIWNHQGTCIQLSTHMAGVGLEMYIFDENFEKQNDCVWMVLKLRAKY